MRVQCPPLTKKYSARLCIPPLPPPPPPSPLPLSRKLVKIDAIFAHSGVLSRFLHRSSVFPNSPSYLVATLRKQTKTKHRDINNLSRRRYRGVTQRGDVDGVRCIKYEIQYKLSRDINSRVDHLAAITSRLHSPAAF